MLRRFLLPGVLVAAAAVMVPTLHQHDPEAVESFLRSLFKSDEQEGKLTVPSVTVGRADVEPRTEVLTGKRVRVPADAGGHYTADFKLNGRDVRALVDTGATYVAVNSSTARDIGIKLTPADFRHQVKTANGATPAAAVVIDTLQIGRIYVDNVQAVVLADTALDGTLVGLSFLNRLGRVQVEGGALVLEQ